MVKDYCYLWLIEGTISSIRQHPVDSSLVQIAEIMSEALRRSGAWIVCRPGCTECCMGPFDINEADARRLRQGLAELEAADPPRAVRVRARAAAWVESADAPCPALDPATGWCDLYESRPVTCRVFGPATRIGEDAVGACELCYAGATDEQIAACAVDVDMALLETDAPTTVAEALTSACAAPPPESASPAMDCKPRRNRSGPGK